MIELVFSSLIVLTAMGIFMGSLAAMETAYILLDKLVAIIRRHKEKAPRTLQRPKAQEKNYLNDSVA